MMQITETLSEGLKREYLVSLPPGEVAQKFHENLSVLQKQVRINGFRPGKVPLNHLMRLHGNNLLREIVEEVVQEAPTKIVEQYNLRPAAGAEVNLPQSWNTVSMDTSMGTKEFPEVAFEVKFELLPEVEIGSFDDITLERWQASPDEKEIQAYVANWKQGWKRRRMNFLPTSQPARLGDEVIMNLQGTLDGQPFAGSEKKHFSLILGENVLGEKVDQQLEGAKVRSKKQINVLLPAGPFQGEELQGKEAVFEVDILHVNRPEALREDFLKEQDQVGILSERFLKARYERLSRLYLKKNLFDILDSRYSFLLPQKLVDMEFQNIWQKVLEEQEQEKTQALQVKERDQREASSESSEESRSALEGQVEPEASVEEMQAEYRKIAERRVRLGILFSALGHSQNIQVEWREIALSFYHQASLFPGKEQETYRLFSGDEKMVAAERARLFEEKVVDYILSLAQITEKTVTPEEFKEIAEEEVEGSLSEIALIAEMVQRSDFQSSFDDSGADSEESPSDLALPLPNPPPESGTEIQSNSAQEER